MSPLVDARTQALGNTLAAIDRQFGKGLILRLDGPAEAAVAYLAMRHQLKVYHVDSSVAFSFEADPRVRLQNVAPHGWALSDLPEVSGVSTNETD